jgi:hypothetical protein
LSDVNVVELDSAAGIEPVHWLLQTTHAVVEVAQAHRVVSWYR